MHNVTNETFETALANEDNRRILSSVSRKYRSTISGEELKFRGYMALFYCLQKHKDGQGTKFTSSLWRHMHWQCKKALRDILRHPPLLELQFEYETPISIPSEIFHVRDCLELLPVKHSNILKCYHLQGMTFVEIGQENGYSAPTAMQKLRKAEEAFRRLYGDD